MIMTAMKGSFRLWLRGGSQVSHFFGTKEEYRKNSK
jgi:hypothetical protein